MDRQVDTDIGESENILYVAIMMDIHDYTCVTKQELHKTKSEP